MEHWYWSTLGAPFEAVTEEKPSISIEPDSFDLKVETLYEKSKVYKSEPRKDVLDFTLTWERRIGLLNSPSRLPISVSLENTMPTSCWSFLNMPSFLTSLFSLSSEPAEWSTGKGCRVRITQALSHNDQKSEFKVSFEAKFSELFFEGFCFSMIYQGVISLSTSCTAVVGRALRIRFYWSID